MHRLHVHFIHSHTKTRQQSSLPQCTQDTPTIRHALRTPTMVVNSLTGPPRLSIPVDPLHTPSVESTLNTLQSLLLPPPPPTRPEAAAERTRASPPPPPVPSTAWHVRTTNHAFFRILSVHNLSLSIYTSTTTLQTKHVYRLVSTRGQNARIPLQFCPIDLVLLSTISNDANLTRRHVLYVFNSHVRYSIVFFVVCTCVVFDLSFVHRVSTCPTTRFSSPPYTLYPPMDSHLSFGRRDDWTECPEHK